MLDRSPTERPDGARCRRPHCGSRNERPEFARVAFGGPLVPPGGRPALNRVPRALTALLVLVACHPQTQAGPFPAPFTGPVLAVAGCHVLASAVQRVGQPTDLLFPFFFELDSMPRPGADSAARTFRFSRDDLNRWAGDWSWDLAADTIRVDAIAGEQAYHLRARLDGAEWSGVLVASEGGPVAEWEVKGRRVPCPARWREITSLLHVSPAREQPAGQPPRAYLRSFDGTLRPDELVRAPLRPGGGSMATYLYHCLACGHDFERAESMSQHEHAHPACPKCKSAKVEQILAPFFAKTGRKA